jgi:hypothetical protein
MATGVRSSDIIATVFGARHRGKMQEVQGLQYVNQQKAAQAKAESEQKDKLFSRGLEVAKSFTPESASEVMRTGNPMLGVKPPSDRQEKANAERVSNNQYADWMETPEGAALFKKNFGEHIDMKAAAKFVRDMGPDAWNKMVDQGQEQQKISVAQQRLSIAKKAGDPKAPVIPKWKADAFFAADPYAAKVSARIQDYKEKIAEDEASLKKLDSESPDKQIIPQLIASRKKRMRLAEQELANHYAKFVESSNTSVDYELDPESLNENLDLLFPELMK